MRSAICSIGSRILQIRRLSLYKILLWHCERLPAPYFAQFTSWWVGVPLGFPGGCSPLMKLEHPVDDGDVPPLHFEDHNVPDTDRVLLVVGQEEQVTPVECWLHAPTETEGSYTLLTSYGQWRKPLLYKLSDGLTSRGVRRDGGVKGQFFLPLFSNCSGYTLAPVPLVGLQTTAWKLFSGTLDGPQKLVS